MSSNTTNTIQQRAFTIPNIQRITSFCIHEPLDALKLVYVNRNFRETMIDFKTLQLRCQRFASSNNKDEIFTDLSLFVLELLQLAPSSQEKADQTSSSSSSYEAQVSLLIWILEEMFEMEHKDEEEDVVCHVNTLFMPRDKLMLAAGTNAPWIATFSGCLFKNCAFPEVTQFALEKSLEKSLEKFPENFREEMTFEFVKKYRTSSLLVSCLESRKSLSFGTLNFVLKVLADCRTLKEHLNRRTGKGKSVLTILCENPKTDFKTMKLLTDALGNADYLKKQIGGYDEATTTPLLYIFNNKDLSIEALKYFMFKFESVLDEDERLDHLAGYNQFSMNAFNLALLVRKDKESVMLLVAQCYRRSDDEKESENSSDHDEESSSVVVELDLPRLEKWLKGKDSIMRPIVNLVKDEELKRDLFDNPGQFLKDSIAWWNEEKKKF